MAKRSRFAGVLLTVAPNRNGLHPMIDPTKREPLDENLIQIVAYASALLGEESTRLIDQARAAVVTEFSPTMVDVEVPATLIPVDLPDGPIPGRFIIERGGEEMGEVLIWLRSGRLIGLEQAWWSDTRPSSWPSTSSIRRDASTSGAWWELDDE